MSQSAPVFTALVRVPYGLPKGAKAVLTAAATLTRRRLYIALDGWPASLSIASLLAKLQASALEVCASARVLGLPPCAHCAAPPALSAPSRAHAPPDEHPGATRHGAHVPRLPRVPRTPSPP